MCRCAGVACCGVQPYRFRGRFNYPSGGPQNYEKDARIDTAKARKLVFVRANLKVVEKEYDPRPFITLDPDSVADEEEIQSSDSDGDVDFKSLSLGG